MNIYLNYKGLEMENKFFTADQHFFHKNIITYCKRPYRDIKQMNNDIIKKHNEVVPADGIVFHLGDFAMLGKDKIMKIVPILEKMNGQHHLILGNHDDNHSFTYVNMGFASVHTSLYIDEFLLIHDPAMAVAVEDDQKVLCGHLHELTTFVNPNILNVGVDIWEYKPVSIEQVRNAFESGV